MDELTRGQWILAILAALGIGVSKSGFAGLGMFHVVVFASLFDARKSTGIVLPMLIVGDMCAVLAFQRHARWDYIRKMLPPALIGVAIGAWLMAVTQGVDYGPILGGILVGLIAMQIARMRYPRSFDAVPHTLWFAWTLGLLSGVTTMLANAAGPIMAIYFLSVSLPKNEFVGTSAWFFLLLNFCKLPFSGGLGLIDTQTLSFNAMLAPVIALGIVIGSRTIRYVPQRLFDGLLLAFAALAAVRLIGKSLFPEYVP